jgi:hypothetical protein
MVTDQTLLKRRRDSKKEAIRDTLTKHGVNIYMVEEVRRAPSPHLVVNAICEDILNAANLSRFPDKDNDLVELTPTQAGILYQGWMAERNRARHEAEPWASQAERDAVNRDARISEAVAAGVPERQAMRFVMSEPWEEEE